MQQLVRGINPIHHVCTLQLNLLCILLNQLEGIIMVLIQSLQQLRLLFTYVVYDLLHLFLDVGLSVGVVYLPTLFKSLQLLGLLFKLLSQLTSISQHVLDDLAFLVQGSGDIDGVMFGVFPQGTDSAQRNAAWHTEILDFFIMFLTFEDRDIG